MNTLIKLDVGTEDRFKLALFEYYEHDRYFVTNQKYIVSNANSLSIESLPKSLQGSDSIVTKDRDNLLGDDFKFCDIGEWAVPVKISGSYWWEAIGLFFDSEVELKTSYTKDFIVIDMNFGSEVYQIKSNKRDIDVTINGVSVEYMSEIFNFMFKRFGYNVVCGDDGSIEMIRTQTLSD